MRVKGDGDKPHVIQKNGCVVKSAKGLRDSKRRSK
jgi:hypothetical protein